MGGTWLSARKFLSSARATSACSTKPATEIRNYIRWQDQGTKPKHFEGERRWEGVATASLCAGTQLADEDGVDVMEVLQLLARSLPTDNLRLLQKRHDLIRSVTSRPRQETCTAFSLTQSAMFCHYMLPPPACMSPLLLAAPRNLELQPLPAAREDQGAVGKQVVAS